MPELTITQEKNGALTRIMGRESDCRSIHNATDKYIAITNSGEVSFCFLLELLTRGKSDLVVIVPPHSTLTFNW